MDSPFSTITKLNNKILMMENEIVELKTLLASRISEGQTNMRAIMEGWKVIISKKKMILQQKIYWFLSCVEG